MIASSSFIQELFLAMGSSSSASSSVPSVQSNSGDSILAPDYSPIQSSDESVVPDNVSSSGQSDQPNCLHSNNLSPTNDKEQGGTVVYDKKCYSTSFLSKNRHM